MNKKNGKSTTDIKNEMLKMASDEMTEFIQPKALVTCTLKEAFFK
jgi:hypothetical protein